VLADKAFKQGKGMNIVELMMLKEDAPETLKILVGGSAKRNNGDTSEADEKREVKDVEEKATKITG